MVSTCGKTVRHEQNYYSSFEDAFGNVGTKELARPAIAHMLYEFLPLIDEHNKARQSALALEKCWPTKSGWFRVLTTLVGMAAIDLLRWDGHVSCGAKGSSLRADVMDDFDIIEMANLIAKPLRTGQLSYRKGEQPSQKRASNGDDDGGDLIRIRGEDGTARYPSKNGKCGKARQKSCFVCRKYKPLTQNTQWMCRKCGMSLCSIGRGQAMSCLQEHRNSACSIMGCCKMERNRFIMPDKMKVYLRTRTGAIVHSKKKENRRKAPPVTTPSPPTKRYRR